MQSRCNTTVPRSHLNKYLHTETFIMFLCAHVCQWVQRSQTTRRSRTVQWFVTLCFWIPESSCAESASSPRVCMTSLQVLLLPRTAQRPARDTNGQLRIGSGCESGDVDGCLSLCGPVTNWWSVHRCKSAFAIRTSCILRSWVSCDRTHMGRKCVLCEPAGQQSHIILTNNRQVCRSRVAIGNVYL